LLGLPQIELDMKLDGKEYWRSLDQLADSEEFRQWLHHEFPKGTPELAGNNNWSRRNFLTLMGASFALAGLAGCRKPVEKIVPYVNRPEGIEPGVAVEYATTAPLGLDAYGVVVTCREGRPIHIRGNERHSSSRGGTNPLVQASILNLYDPDRSRTVLHAGKESTWDEFIAWWRERYAQYKENGGAGLAVLSESFNSPTLARLRREFEQAFPQAQWVAWEPISDENIYAGLEAATGQKLKPVYAFDKAKVVLALDCDFLGTESNAIANTAGFADGRRVTSRSDDMSRLYAVEPALTVTGMNADHRVRCERSRVGIFVDALVNALLRLDDNLDLRARSITHDFDQALIDALAEDLYAHRGECLVVAGRAQAPQMQVEALALNRALGAINSTVFFYEMPDAVASDSQAFQKLMASLSGGDVETVVVLGGNPAYHVPESGEALKKAGTLVRLGMHNDETSVLASWQLPRSHYMESWADARSADGTASVIQPLIAPLFDSRSDVEFASLLTTGEVATENPVPTTWTELLGKQDFDKKWGTVLHDGVHQSLTPVTDLAVLPAVPERSEPPAVETELIFVPSVLFDGRFANNGWLQELPDPATKITWDNAALFSPRAGEQHKIKNGDVVRLTTDRGSIEIPAWISPGQADNSISVALGYGRTSAGQVGSGVGISVYPLRSIERPWFVGGVKVEKIGRKQVMACTQDHGSMEGRPIVRENTLAGYKEKAEFFPAEIDHPEPTSLWEEHTYKEGYQWGMSIDLNACTGCNACVIACQSENNIPVVGKEQTGYGREMHWMRIDRYYAGDINDPEVAVQPMNCQHCELAPCEQVCPVAATTHDREGLNVMVYNRCIGTRYCSNNCPYKVRRFNFFNYTKEMPVTLQMQQNPEVTVRFRGVMEKCTYCTQRIQLTKIKAKNEGRAVADGEIQTACQQACPARAIVFGNINDPNSEVARLKNNDRKYRVLEELNTRPRTTYMAKLRNPNPKLVKGAPPSHSEEHEPHQG